MVLRATIDEYYAVSVAVNAVETLAQTGTA